MLMAWDQIAVAALLASTLALVLLLLFNASWKSLTIPRVAGLTLCAGIGLALWFIIFNIFSLGVLDFDFPIPLFPVSPEDLSCMVLTGLVAFIYWFVVIRLPRQGNPLTNESQLAGGQIINNPSRLRWWVWVLPALAALVIDIYFI
jgi:hypothetical protein